MKLYLLLLLATLGLAMACATAKAAEPGTNGNIGPYYFSYPSGWKRTDEKVGYKAVFTDPLPTEEQYKFLARMWVSYQPTSATPKEHLLDDSFVASHTAGNTGNAFMPNFSLLSKDDAVLLGIPARRYEYTGEYQSIPVRGITILTLANGHFVDVTLLIPQTTKHSEDYLPIFMSMVSSLTHDTSIHLVHGLSKIPANLRPKAGVQSSSSSSSSSSAKVKAVKKIPVKKPRGRSASSTPVSMINISYLSA